MSDLPEMPCQELVEVVTDYLEDALGADDRRRFEAHLEDCGWCRRYLAQLQSITKGAFRLEPEAIPPSTRGALLDAFRSWSSGR